MQDSPPYYVGRRIIVTGTSYSRATWTAGERAFQKWREQVAGRIVVVEIGAGNAIPSVRRFSANMHDVHGAAIVRINPTDATLNGDKGVALACGALKALTQIDAAMT